MNALGSFGGKTLTSIDSEDLELAAADKDLKAVVTGDPEPSKVPRAASPGCSICFARRWVSAAGVP